jgi:hypothetical protein
MKQVNGQKVYSLDFTDAQLALIHEALMVMPYGRVAALVNTINLQLAAEVESPKTPAERMAEHHGRYGGEMPHA